MADNTPVMWTVTALFDNPEGAQNAISELQGHGIAPSDISLTVQGWDADEKSADAMTSAEGVARREVGTSNTSRVTPELPNDEELATTEAYMTGGDTGVTEREVPIVLDHDIPPDEPIGGGLRLGIDKKGYDEVQPADHDMVRRSDASADADVDIYTDFPDEPGGLRPDSALVGADAGEGHAANSGLPPAQGSGATVSVRADDTQGDFVRGILKAHGGRVNSPSS